MITKKKKNIAKKDKIITENRGRMRILNKKELKLIFDLLEKIQKCYKLKYVRIDDIPKGTRREIYTHDSYKDI